MPFITAIKTAKPWVEIELDGAFFLRLRSAVFQALTLREGDALDPQAFCSAALPAVEYEPALKAALAYLAPRSRTVREITQRLERSGYHEAAIDRVIERLQALRLIGDERFAQDWAASRSGRAVGKRRIQQELSRKGVEQDQIQTALDGLDPAHLQEQALALARKLCAKHAHCDRQEQKRKVTQALIRRGFDWDQASSAYRDALDPESF